MRAPCNPVQARRDAPSRGQNLLAVAVVYWLRSFAASAMPLAMVAEEACDQCVPRRSLLLRAPWSGNRGNRKEHQVLGRIAHQRAHFFVGLEHE